MRLHVPYSKPTFAVNSTFAHRTHTKACGNSLKTLRFHDRRPTRAYELEFSRRRVRSDPYAAGLRPTVEGAVPINVNQRHRVCRQRQPWGSA
jgi:hypothetical protein